MQCTGGTRADAGQAAHARSFNHDHRALWVASFNRIFCQRQQGFEGAEGNAQVATCAGRIGDAHHGLSHARRARSDLLSPAHAPNLAEGLKGSWKSQASWWSLRPPWSGWNV